MKKETIFYFGGLGENEQDFLYQKIKKVWGDQYEIKPFFWYKHENKMPPNITEKIRGWESKLGSKSKIIFIGHSLGAYTSLFFNKISSKIILLEPSNHPKEIFNDIGIKLPTIKRLILKNRKKPVLIIGADKGGYKIAYKYHSYCSPAYSKVHILRGCDHNFSKEKNIKDLFKIIKMTRFL